MVATERADYIAGLRALADALDSDPALPLPYRGTSSIAVFTETAEENAAYFALLDTASVEYRPGDRWPHRTTGTLRGLGLYVWGPGFTPTDVRDDLALELELIP